MTVVPSCLQENIELAKKDWELSHLQSLREEEERLAEEEADEVMLTYDRPETANKVILRRRPSTGTWEVCSQGQEEPYDTESPLVVNSVTQNQSDVQAPLPETWSPEPVSTDHPISGSSDNKHRHRRKYRHSEGSTADSSRAASPGSPPAGTRRHSSRLTAAAHTSDSGNPSPTKRELRQRHEDPEYKPPGSGGKRKSPRVVPRKPATPSAPVVPLSNSAPSLTMPASNHVVDSEDEGSISSRTRHKSSPLVGSASFTTCSPQQESPNHKYPTRRKLTNQI